MILETRRISILGLLVLGALVMSASHAADSAAKDLCDKGLAAIEEKRYLEGAEQVLAGVELAAKLHAWGDAYWYAWRLALVQCEAWDEAQRIEWFDLAESYIEKRNRSRSTWKTLDLFNWVQLLCQKETAYTFQGSFGRGYLTYSLAEEKMIECLGEGYEQRDPVSRSHTHLGVYLNLLLDRAAHQLRSGRLPEAALTFERAERIADEHLAPGSSRQSNLCRILTNFGNLLSTMGRMEAADVLSERAAQVRGAGSALLIAEVCCLRRESQRNGPSEAVITKLEEKAEALREAGRYVAALLTRRQLATVLFYAGRTDEAMTQFKSVIDEATKRGYGIVTAQTHLWRAKARTQGDLPGAEEDLLAALEFYRREGQKPKEFDVYRAYARLLLATGRYDEGQRIVAEALRLAEFMEAPCLQPELLVLRARALLEVGSVEQAEGVWREMDDLLDRLPALDARKRLRVHVGRMEFLAATGQREELARVRARVQSFADRSNLTEHEKAAFLAFDPESVELVKRLPAVTARVDLQPFFLSTRTCTGTPALAWLWLMNPGMQPEQGTLEVEAPGPVRVQTCSSEELALSIGVLGTQAMVTVSEPLSLPRESTLCIRMTLTNAPTDTPAVIRVRWGAGGALESRWNVIADADRMGLATIHASLQRRNPFYSVPVYHEIGRYEDGDAGYADFRVRASAPCRIEVYNLHDGKLIAADTNGDGSCLDPSDVLCADGNRNGIPDVPALANRIVIHVFPAPDTEYDAPLDLTLEIIEADEWRVCGSDRIVGF